MKNFLLVLALGSSQGLFAQGLGELTLNSALNEPLQANIELLDVAGLDPEQLVIRLASPEEYQQAGLEYSEFLTNINVDSSIAAAGNGVLSLRSERRVNEPFLTLLVSARWPAGRVMREYTVLLDLPGHGRRGSLPASLPVSEAPRAPATAAASRPVAVASPGTHTVGSGDSLWAIAEQTRPSAGVSVPQMMLAIQRANEDAFVNNDINQLLSGRVLRIPAPNEIAMVDAGEALALVNAPRPAGAAALGVPAANPAVAGADDALSVLTSDDAVEAAGSSDLQATIAALENALLLSEEELDRARLQNEDLVAQLGELEEQIAILQNIIAIEDERLASLQQSLAAQAEAATAAMAQSGQASQILTTQGPASQGLLARGMQLLANNLIALGVALLLVILVLVLLLQRARQARIAHEEDDELDFDDDEFGQDESDHDEFDDDEDDENDEDGNDQDGNDQDGNDQDGNEEHGGDQDGGAGQFDPLHADDSAGLLAPGISDEPDEPVVTIEDAIQDAVTATPLAETAAGDSVADDIESFEFKLDQVAPSSQAAAGTIDKTIETLDFKFTPDSSLQDTVSGSDMSDFTFDENDITFDDEDDAVYTPRTNMDECDTKLDLAVAYEAMGDMVGAVEILEDVIAEGKPEQIAEAQRLKSQWQGD